MKLTTLGWELKALDSMNSSALWLTLMTLGIELKDLDVMNRPGLLMT